MNDEDIIIQVFVCVDDIIQSLPLDRHPGPLGKMSLSELLTVLLLQPLLKPGSQLKTYYRWFFRNWNAYFP